MPFSSSGLPSGEIKSFPRVETNLDCAWLAVAPANRRRKTQHSNSLFRTLVICQFPRLSSGSLCTRKIDWPRMVFDFALDLQEFEQENPATIEHPRESQPERLLGESRLRPVARIRAYSWWCLNLGNNILGSVTCDGTLCHWLKAPKARNVIAWGSAPGEAYRQTVER
jgi:hypothetical protein